MIHLPKTRDAWNSAEFDRILKSELEAIDANLLPLQQGLALSSRVSEQSFNVIVVGSEASAAAIRCRVTIIYAGIIAGCSCADDPTPLDSVTECCELQLEVDRVTAKTKVTLLNTNL